MIFHDMEQGTPEWDDIRAGKFTASIASKLVTATGRPSSQYRGEIGRLIAEKMDWQEPEPFQSTYWMDRGTELEEDARLWFQVETGKEVYQCGFVEDDGGLVGFSPDGIIKTKSFVNRGGVQQYDVSPLELKVPKPSTHIKWLLEGELPSEHRAQVHFAMAVMGSATAFFMSYSPNCDPLLIEVERDDYTEKMVLAIDKFKAEYMDAFKRITGIDHESL